MFVALLRLYFEVAQASPLVYVGLLVLLMASWGLIIGTLADVAVRVFDIAGE